MRIPRAGEPRQTQDPIAAEDASRLAVEAGPILERATNVQWYELPGNDVDRAAFTLCRLRRARAGGGGGPQHGDDAVRNVLAQASPEALVWFASRAVSYLDENGFPDAVAPWFRDEDEPAG
jgi:hypothetical protein